MKLITSALLVSLGFSFSVGAKLNTQDTQTMEKVKSFLEYNIRQNRGYKLESIKFDKQTAIKDSGNWNTYSFDLVLTETSSNRQIKHNAQAYSNGRYLTNMMFDLKKNNTLQQLDRQEKENAQSLKFEMDKSYYNDKHLIIGDKNAKDKVVIFSDPLCPACISTIPTILKKAKEKKNIAVYYYDFPLNIHPAAFTISKAAIYAKEHKLVKDLEYKIYTANFQEFNTNTQRFASMTDPQTILNAFNKKIGTNITLKQLNQASVQTTLDGDLLAGEKNEVRGTPTVILNGKKAFKEGDRTVSSRQKLFDILR